MQPAGGQHRQAAGLGQACRIAHTLGGQQAGLVLAPGGIAAHASRAEHDDGLGTGGQVLELALGQGLFGLQRACRPLHHHRQAHRPQATETKHEAAQRQARTAAAQPPAGQQEQQQATRRQQQLLEEIANGHSSTSRRCAKPNGDYRYGKAASRRPGRPARPGHAASWRLPAKGADQLLATLEQGLGYASGRGRGLAAERVSLGLAGCCSISASSSAAACQPRSQCRSLSR